MGNKIGYRISTLKHPYSIGWGVHFYRGSGWFFKFILGVKTVYVGKFV